VGGLASTWPLPGPIVTPFAVAATKKQNSIDPAHAGCAFRMTSPFSREFFDKTERKAAKLDCPPATVN
jgi:hypothetical protein